MTATRRNTQRFVTRREALRTLGLFAASVAAACTPLRVVANVHPAILDTDADLADRVLRAFVATVIPGACDAVGGGPDAIRHFRDPAYPFARYATFFAGDLCRRGADRFGVASFDALSPAQRIAVIEEGLAADAVTRKLYTGAVFLTQVAVYAGIYDDAAGCALIGFEGRYRYRGPEAYTYPDPDRFLAPALTATGNPV